MQKLVGYLRLTRPANIVTAISDILAGIGISGYLNQHPWEFTPVLLLVLATIGLYGGGVVMNDYFDATLDERERPERPIPSGLISRKEALVLGLTLLLGGIISALFLWKSNGDFTPGVIAITIAIAALTYDKWSKHHAIYGPLNMGMCRALNLLLGISIIPAAVLEFWPIAFVPLTYIAAITLISRGEVHGGRKNTLFIAAFLYVLVMACILYVSIDKSTVFYAVLFVLLWAVLIFPPLKKAIARPEGKQIGGAVKAGVIALIAMNAAWAATFDTLYLALVIIILLPLSILLAKLFSVT